MTSTAADRPAMSMHAYNLAYDLLLVAAAVYRKKSLHLDGASAVGLQDVLPGGTQRLDSLRSSSAAFVSCATDLNRNTATILMRSVSQAIEQIQDPTKLSTFRVGLPAQALESGKTPLEDLGELGRAIKFVDEYAKGDEMIGLWWSLGGQLATESDPYLDHAAAKVVAKLARRLHTLAGFQWLKPVAGLASLAPGSSVLAKSQEPYVDRGKAAIMTQRLDVFIREQLVMEKSLKVLLSIHEAGVVLLDQHIPRAAFRDAHWRIFLCLAEHAGIEVTRSKLFRAYQGVDGNDNNAVAVHISGLRKALKPVFANSPKPEDLAVQSVDELIVGIRQENGGGPYKLALNKDQVVVNL